jgi:hypothetical protein
LDFQELFRLAHELFGGLPVPHRDHGAVLESDSDDNTNGAAFKSRAPRKGRAPMFCKWLPFELRDRKLAIRRLAFAPLALGLVATFAATVLVPASPASADGTPAAINASPNSVTRAPVPTRTPAPIGPATQTGGFNLPAPPLPDLSVQATWEWDFHEHCFGLGVCLNFSGRTLKLHMEVHNRGAAASPATHVRVDIFGEVDELVSVPAIPANSIARFPTRSYACPTGPALFVKLMVDPNHQVTETNEGNNQFSSQCN